MKSFVPLIAALALLITSLPCKAADIRARREGKSSVARLAEAYGKAKDPDARFWIVDALHHRLEAEGDEEVMKILIEAARDPQPDVRRRALSALQDWRSLPPPARSRWRDRVEAAAAHAAAEKGLRVREAGEGLAAVLRSPVKTIRSGPVVRRGLPSRRRAAATAALWAISVQFAALAWAFLASSLLRQCGERGALALDNLAAVLSCPEYLVFPCLSVAALLFLVGTGGALALIGALSPTAGHFSPRAWVACAGAMYFVCGLAAFVPAALLARRAGRAGPPGAIRSLAQSLWDVPGCVALGVTVLIFWPAGLAAGWSEGPAQSDAPDTTPAPEERGIGVGQNSRRPAWRWLAAVGAPLGGLLAAAESGRAGVSWTEGLAQASRRPRLEDASQWLARPLAQGPLLLLYFSAPFVFALAALPAQALGMEPLGVFELFFISDTGVAWIFGVWAGAVAVALFLGFWFAASGLYAAKVSTT